VMSPRPGRIRQVLDMKLAGERTEELREDTRFFENVSAVREALHGAPAKAGNKSGKAKGVDIR
jgi:NitT/TauT family transport system ATP-binding protein